MSHVAAAAVPHAADAATPRATRDAGRAARDERRDSMTALLLMGAAAAQRALSDAAENQRYSSTIRKYGRTVATARSSREVSVQ